MSSESKVGKDGLVGLVGLGGLLLGKRFKEAVWMENDLRKPWKGTNESMNVGVYYSDYLHVGTY